jgi:hypothetical protein
MTTYKQDCDFIKAVVDTSLLEEAVEWISVNMDPEEVFSRSDLGYWAEHNGYKLEDADE